MKVLRGAAAIAALSARWRARGQSIGFVPTMGALHAGHRSLIERARRENDRVIVSIFVNPLQFGPAEDFARYPRSFSKDRRFCAKAGVDALYHPGVDEMYPPGFQTRVELPALSEKLCGKFRPGHFQGVATVVLKLFEQARPDRAYFGEKDFQQLVVIRRMARDLALGVRIVGCPTVREKDGLALSSRNAGLTPRQRSEAPALYRALRLGLTAIKQGASLSQARSMMRRRLQEIPGARIDYAEIVDPDTLEAPRRTDGRLRALAAIRLGKTRLIDNIPLLCQDGDR